MCCLKACCREAAWKAIGDIVERPYYPNRVQKLLENLEQEAED
jgi:hypothetical protein